MDQGEPSFVPGSSAVPLAQQSSLPSAVSKKGNQNTQVGESQFYGEDNGLHLSHPHHFGVLRCALTQLVLGHIPPVI